VRQRVAAAATGYGVRAGNVELAGKAGESVAWCGTRREYRYVRYQRCGNVRHIVRSSANVAVQARSRIWPFGSEALW